ncbi:Uncharacterized protein GY17_00000798 [Cryptosporidium hominis]|uniref:Uncharacterized protein n=1 Tax=Cryptosporidium hominis TaxID=237895 RepID=A0ABX5BIY4_CRYHO|nr:Uncharacterized protein GY17_00000798 [Cryptosporidium hominis]|eukprot:PPS98317.1 Uncharacterized protein GY17_00000798 [Cryptosporidium hominis]
MFKGDNEIFSFGFIDESFQNNGETDSILIESIHSKRILLSSNVSTISEVFQELPLSTYIHLWMNFKNVSKDYLESGQKYVKDDAFNSANSTITNSFNQTQISVDSSDTIELIKNLSKKKEIKVMF